MRLQVTINDDLMAEAMKTLGTSTVKATVEMALKLMLEALERRGEWQHDRGINLESNPADMAKD
jgi:Arc/MetJ family transcription regulator